MTLPKRWSLVIPVALCWSCGIDGLPSVVLELGDGGASFQACEDEDDDGHTGCGDVADCDDTNGNVHPGADEVCNGLDDDCDGRTDELVAGIPCVLEAGGCSVQGVTVCEDGLLGWGLRCDAGGLPELCNLVDDDCDGNVDEGDPGGGGSCDSGGIGACAEGTFVCSSGALGCTSITTPGASEESCNGRDDDCDGVVDEGPGGSPGVPSMALLTASCYFGPQGTLGVGKCSAGSWTCVDGEWGACIGEVRPVAEVCDGEDNDCDDEVDNTQEECECDYAVSAPESCYTGPPGTQGVGLCAGGSRTCEADDSWSDCGGQVLPTQEHCDGLDNDCDGMLDEDFNVGGACSLGTGECERGGTLACAADPTAPSECVVPAPGVPAMGNPELCDGLDNDCDGRVDESDGAMAACTSGQGACARDGVLVCDLAAAQFVCNAEAGMPTAETCDTVDNDCDGVVDEGFDVGSACDVGVGACTRSGTIVCNFDATAVCNVQPGGPSVETCDGLDNDCDESVDEGFGIGNACAATGVCAAGILECVGGSAACSTHPGGTGDQSSLETCDGLDNDCDGLVDEGFGVGVACTYWYGCGIGDLPGVGACDPSGYSGCSSAPWGADAPVEVCNGLDDDCDFNTDEGLVCP